MITIYIVGNVCFRNPLLSKVTASNPVQMVESMTYTRAVIKEILRFRPPAVMVPSIAMVDFKLDDTCVAPKGSLVVPSIWAACFQGFTNPDVFDPDRMGYVHVLLLS